MSLESKTVYVALGGDIGDVLERLKMACHSLKWHIDLRNFRCSHFYLTSPFEMDSLNPFVNAVCAFETCLTPEEVYKITSHVEISLGRVAKFKNESRKIDLDLLFYGHESLVTPDLIIPHPRWKERLFVLVPLRDLTKTIEVKEENQTIIYMIDQLIESMTHQNDGSIATSQKISLLEKNVGLQ